MLDDRLGGRRPDLWKLIQFLLVGGVYVYREGGFLLRREFFERRRIHEFGSVLGDTRSIESSAD